MWHHLLATLFGVDVIEDESTEMSGGSSVLAEARLRQTPFSVLDTSNP